MTLENVRKVSETMIPMFKLRNIWAPFLGKIESDDGREGGRRGKMDLKVIVVDDEWLALKKMEKLLVERSELDVKVELVGIFNDPYQALELAQQEKVDIAFLDVQMPEIDGFELAERFQQIQPHIRIIFVTAYQEYAVKAFEMNALDYLLKPVHQTRLATTLKRAVESNVTSKPLPKDAAPLTLCCLQSLHYIDTLGNVRFFPWKTLKAPELFAYLVYYRNKTVSKQMLIDLLWPGYDAERATAQLYTAIYQIRKIIKAAGLDLEIKYKDEGYRMVWGTLRLDVDDWENDVRQAAEVTPDTLDNHLSIKARYTGDFLEEHRYLWAEYEQDRIRLIWLDHVKQIAECYISQGQYTEAILLYQEMKEKVPDMEEGYFGLMKVHALLNHQAEVRKQFQLISNIFKEEFDVPPSKELTDWYEQWNNDIQRLNLKIGRM
ncbi:Two-component response regulator, SAPR family, consists of REC, wHTH and BTAD domains [Paenibacillus uliginis N3/975]|uniref:Two-component response regulator, SAPR family, consists of REC, wHTH and BTAD domains n=2 Tax=Paenibacillus TaxID=44249 RepID=A0A1X7GQW2_9BACL|nr:Two-component response regulator, SAPR family, consists of REC, wHTH and BTAD domains [Paenibacillus uliginis N3/975]